MERDNLISSETLTLADVPPPDAELLVLEEFCLTIDGYQDGRLSMDDLIGLALRVERSALEDASLDDLRAAAFIRQRELRWTSMDFGHFDGRLVRSIRTLVDEIRRRVEERAQNGS